MTCLQIHVITDGQTASLSNFKKLKSARYHKNIKELHRDD